MSELGLGACLADDMGLGKTLQVLALVQHQHERARATGTPNAPTLIVCPTSVLTNWHHEARRFTPELDVVVHHGAGRLRGDDLVEHARGQAIVLTSYALLARDIERLRAVPWRAIVLDEAQNIKNPGTRHARAARSIAAPTRIALTGTPVENHAGDLWSIMEFLNPGLLGTQVDFRRKYLVPIQTGTFPEAAARLRQVVAPFLLRREKTDRDVIEDLPDKFEHVAWANLTTEQASLYEAIVREAADTLRMPVATARRSGIERRGLILATIAKLKQACNHPAQLLADGSRIAGRSGKLARLEGLLETVLDRGERALVFTQFVAMGQLLQAQLADTFGREVLFLHGGTSRAERDRIVERFQDSGAGAPPILVLSLKAGGSGLNLTAATHVFHYDRWWNPATEQQATDRAFRIGQQRDVQVHALVCAGTVEERIDHMLRQKRDVADTVVGSGEQWITELDDAELLDLLTLRRDTMLQDGRLDHLDPREWQRGTL
jgi:SNF2 family DNA or RNA helicase